MADLEKTDIDHPPVEAFDRVMRVARQPSTDARTVAILGAAYLENFLVDLITDKMPGLNSELRNKLFGSGGAISELSTKIDIARSLDVIGPSYRRDSILVARIRNRFAHHIDIQDFDDPEIAALTAELSYPKIAVPEVPFEGTPRERFVRTIEILHAALSNALNDIRHRKLREQQTSADK